jgi:hypothetical protein
MQSGCQFHDRLSLVGEMPEILRHRPRNAGPGVRLRPGMRIKLRQILEGNRPLEALPRSVQGVLGGPRGAPAEASEPSAGLVRPECIINCFFAILCVFVEIHECRLVNCLASIVFPSFKRSSATEFSKCSDQHSPQSRADPSEFLRLALTF